LKLIFRCLSVSELNVFEHIFSSRTTIALEDAGIAERRGRHTNIFFFKFAFFWSKFYDELVSFFSVSNLFLKNLHIEHFIILSAYDLALVIFISADQKKIKLGRITNKLIPHPLLRVDSFVNWLRS